MPRETLVAVHSGGVPPYENENYRMVFIMDWKSPEGNVVDHWVLKDKRNGDVIIDHDKYRYSLAERHGLDLRAEEPKKENEDVKDE